jgi:hypothetical protein
MTVFFVTSLSIPIFKVKLMPSVMSGAVIVLSLVALVQELRVGGQTKATDDEGDEVEDEEEVPLRSFFKAFGWFVALIACVYFLGFIITIPLWIFVYLWKNGHRWWISLPQGIGAVVIIYVVFTIVLQVELYQGVFAELFNLHLPL